MVSQADNGLAVWVQAQVQLQDCEHRSAKLELLHNVEKNRLTELQGQAGQLQDEREALGRELAQAKEKAGQLEATLVQLGLQATSAKAEGANLAAQLLLYRERKQESEEQLVKDSRGFEDQIQVLTRKLEQYTAHLAEV